MEVKAVCISFLRYGEDCRGEKSPRWLMEDAGSPSSQGRALSHGNFLGFLASVENCWLTRVNYR